MPHKPIHITHLELTFPHKTCFEDFSAKILPGARIGIIGANGSGKSSLLKILQGSLEPTEGAVHWSKDTVLGYVPQIIDADTFSSGGERFNNALSQELDKQPTVLLLDEPTNHLDKIHREMLINTLKNYSGTLILVSHDGAFLEESVDTLWHIQSGAINIFSGKYSAYLLSQENKKRNLEKNLDRLKKEKKQAHETLMQEQERASKSRRKGEKNIKQRKWPTVVSAAKTLRAVETGVKNQAKIRKDREAIIEELSELSYNEIPTPTFSLTARELKKGNIIQINQGTVSYSRDASIISSIYFSAQAQERIALLGNNGSGKSTFLKGILNEETIVKSGEWHLPAMKNIGYLDQHYSTLNTQETVIETLSNLKETWSHGELRNHLKDFLFRSHEEVNAKVETLSSGEKAKLSFALISATTPQLLLLDEITNNLDNDTRNHVIKVLQHYPGTMIVISHDEKFLKEINISRFYKIEDRKIFRV